ncbi:uncharacterized protein EI90DRAFT_2974599 [Cantharellus anzutake]|uniref:uncharacterized protein n=1 Tax=Cantharellus anzutake TaxID=1750568 RepID=UPI001903A1CB|nr:uncharacterized protein EI90DRAFT_2974599 [Cantharellus anzutake]KAF8328152.1 hypothetical protein EI90DRAFT_2974599 [Cantharellus anzutake]
MPHLQLVMSLSGYVVQSQVTQHVQADLGYRQPYFLFYFAHSSLMIIFPIHVMLLSLYTKIPPTPYLTGLRAALISQMEPTGRPSRIRAFPLHKFLRRIILLTTGVTVPGLLWYIAVSLTSLSDVTAILNCNAMWTYILTVLLVGTKWELHRLLSVVVAVSGVFLIVYGGATSTSKINTSVTFKHSQSLFTSTDVIGDILALIASIAYAVYQVMYKVYIALPVEQDPGSAVLSSPVYERISVDPEAPATSHFDPPSPTTRTQRIPPLAPTTRARAPSGASSLLNSSGDLNDPHTPIPPTFGFHPNFITSCLGLVTFFLLWIPIPILHHLGIERWRSPPDLQTWASIVVVALCGCAYYGGFMILLALWGPVVASVGNLLTIVLVLISDTLFGHAREAVTFLSLAGATMIIGAFSILILEAVLKDRRNREESVIDESE